MEKISIRSTLVLSALAGVSICLLILVESTKKNRKEDWFDEKIEAAQLSERAMNYLKKVHFKNEIFVDNINDPNETGLIGEQYTPITTGSGSLPIKMSTTNPNFAAMVVQLLKDAGLKERDEIAVCMTGSFPALNVSVIAALQTLKIKPIIVTSVTASSWGANDPNFTWLDMEHELYESGIFSHRSSASSIGGNSDIGRALSLEGRDMIEDAIWRNQIKLINEGSLQGNIEKRLQLFEKNTNEVKAFLNVGGGVASLGSDLNGQKIKNGTNFNVKLKEFIDKKGVMFEMAKKGLPIINLLNLESLMKKYELPMEPIPLPEIGKGKLYFAYKYQVSIVAFSLLTLIAMLLGIIYLDKKQHALGNEIIKTNN